MNIKRWLRRTKRKVRRPFEIALVALWMMIGPRLSRRQTLWLAKTISGFVYRAKGRMHRIARANLDHVYGDILNDQQIEDMIRESLYHSALTLLDVFWFSRKAPERLEKYVNIDNGTEYLSMDKPIICITAHYGNWEVLAQKVVQSGFSLSSVAQPLVSEFIDQKFIEMRNISGQEIIPAKGSVRKLLKILKEKGRIALVMDQNTMPKDGGIFVDFFDTPIPCSAAPAMIALRTGAVILFGFCHADSEGYYTVAVPEMISDLPTEGSMDERIHDLTQQITTKLENAIKERPEPWTWTYKRFRHIQPGTDASLYPPYALPMLTHEL